MERYDYVEMRFPAIAEYVGLVRLTLSGILNRAGANYDEIEDTKIAVSEAVTNAVKHAYKDDIQGDVLVGYVIFDNKVEVIVSDSGTSFDYERTKSELGPYEENENIDFIREGGLGLFLIESLMDEVNVKKDSGITISMTKYITEEQV
ncbi:anti-sigma B factor RsbW [Macrococcoides caseolyticum subsp. hominis]|uniref:anti-sigma B factor RsbW n=1 Tax=Macrococcoides caseolyticum TaxID=69966 RepID=UPI000C14A444|nr:anti-sigma B factor RsbW [Macrococcus caseolyticus]RAI79053.1 anti-sigma B factor RsbW [Macrococcus caseolyticus subsp. hominis]